MSESDIRSKFPQAQAASVLDFMKEGWEFDCLEDSEVRLKKPGQYVWVRADGHAYP